jgi:hypothetical protein
MTWKRLKDVGADEMVQTAATGGYIAPSVRATAESGSVRTEATVRIEISPDTTPSTWRTVAAYEVETGLKLGEWRVQAHNSLIVTIKGFKS